MEVQVQWWQKRIDKIDRCEIATKYCRTGKIYMSYNDLHNPWYSPRVHNSLNPCRPNARITKLITQRMGRSYSYILLITNAKFCMNCKAYDCLLNRLFRRGSTKTPKLRVIGLCEENAENVSIWWRHHVLYISRVSCQKGPTRHAYAWQIGPF